MYLFWLAMRILFCIWSYDVHYVGCHGCDGTAFYFLYHTLCGLGYIQVIWLLTTRNIWVSHQVGTLDLTWQRICFLVAFLTIEPFHHMSLRDQTSLVQNCAVLLTPKNCTKFVISEFMWYPYMVNLQVGGHHVFTVILFLNSKNTKMTLLYYIRITRHLLPS